MRGDLLPSARAHLACQLTFCTRLQRLTNFSFERVICHPRKKEVSLECWKSNLRHVVVTNNFYFFRFSAVCFLTKTATDSYDSEIDRMSATPQL